MKKTAIFRYLLIFFLLSANFYVLKRIGLLKIIFFNQGKFLDFDNYYRLIKGMLAGQHPYQNNSDYAPTLGPPSVLIFFLPLALFSLETARVVISLASLMAVFSLAFLLARRFFPKENLLISLSLSLILLTSFPARFSLLMGQPTLILSLLLTLFLMIKKPLLKGLVLSLAVMIKTFFAFLIFALIKKQPRALVWFFLFLSSLIILTLPLIKPLYYFDFFKERFLKISFSPSQPTHLGYYNQSLKSSIFRLGIGQSYTWVYPVCLVLAAFYLFLTNNLEAGIILALLISPVCWQHYFVVLFPLMVKACRQGASKPKFLFFLGLSFFLWWIEMPWLHQAPVNFINGLLASHYFLSALILFFLVK
jgi:hypothetical protein